ncbi:Cellular nucleic acid-binding protein [Bienertia sinuspersici]
MAIVMANKMGKFVEFDSSDPFGYKKFMRFRVDIDPCKPLMRGIKVLVGNVNKWIEFKYEKLPDLCYLCGLFGHGAKECAFYDEEIPESSYPYGNWKRASPTRNSMEGEAPADANERGKLKVEVGGRNGGIALGDDVDRSRANKRVRNVDSVRVKKVVRCSESGEKQYGDIEIEGFRFALEEKCEVRLAY